MEIMAYIIYMARRNRIFYFNAERLRVSKNKLMFIVIKDAFAVGFAFAISSGLLRQPEPNLHYAGPLALFAFCRDGTC